MSGAGGPPSLVPGEPDRLGYRRVIAGDREEMIARVELGGSLTTGPYRSILAFVHLSDLHITDVQSPARAEFLDRQGDSDSPFSPVLGRIGTYRAHEALTVHVVESMAQAVRAVVGAPMTGAALDFAITTGDAIDNAQANELDTYIALLDGGREVVPDSGNPARYEGVGSSDHYDKRYWHPDGSPLDEQEDVPRSEHGFPLVPGLLEACRSAFTATGLGIPWYAVYGNHDALLGGTTPHAVRTTQLATGSLKPAALDDGLDVVALLRGNDTSPRDPQWDPLAGPAWSVTPDARRRAVDRSAWIRAHIDESDSASGHGFDDAAALAGRAYYGFDAGIVRCLVLDTVNGEGGWQGSLDEDQFDWLEHELIAGHRRYLHPDGSFANGGASDRLFLIFSHHPLESLVNDYSPTGAPRRLVDDLAQMLRRFANAVCWFNGHTHTHTVRAVGAHAEQMGGFWEVTTASHVDWPQQGRVVELALDVESGNLLIATATLDHLGARDPRGRALGEATTLAGWSRELSLNAWQGRKRESDGSDAGEPLGRGELLDRNVILVVPAPFPLPSDFGSWQESDACP